MSFRCYFKWIDEFKKTFRVKFPAIYLEIKKKEVEEINNIYNKEFKDLVYLMLNKDQKKRPKADDILKKNLL
jgi:hypothetical protein